MAGGCSSPESWLGSLQQFSRPLLTPRVRFPFSETFEATMKFRSAVLAREADIVIDAGNPSFFRCAAHTTGEASLFAVAVGMTGARDGAFPE